MTGKMVDHQASIRVCLLFRALPRQRRRAITPRYFTLWVCAPVAAAPWWNGAIM